MSIRFSFVRQLRWWVVASLTLVCCGCDKGESRSQPQSKPWEEFSGSNAFEHVRRLVDFGPRPPASAAIKKSRDYITKQLQLFGWQVSPQSFSDATPRGKVSFVNLVSRFSSTATGQKSAPVFLLCSHYDTKIFDAVRFVGANDGGSSSGALLELARVLGQHPALAAKVELVFFDGEEACENFSETDGLYGSRYFAKHLPAKPQQFTGGILLDMIGDRSLTITLPPDSPPQIARDIFASADALQLRDHFTYFENNIIDDHTPLNAAGIPTIDLIDFDFPAWHTAGDTLDKISPQSLHAVGAVTLYYLSHFALK